MAKLDLVCGNEDTIDSLARAMQSKKMAHAVLLCAPDGCGRNFAARCLAADWLFPNGGPGADAVLRGESSEVLTVQGEGKSGQIPVARIRQVRSDVFLSSLSAAGRVVLIRDAHNMAAPAYNALRQSHRRGDYAGTDVCQHCDHWKMYYLKDGFLGRLYLKGEQT